MRFIKTDSSELVAGYLAGLIQGQLDGGGRVLWLLSGGSGIAVAVAAWRLLAPADGRLVIMQIDERYGPVGHANANWGQIEAAGLEPRNNETAIPVLTGKPMDVTATVYGNRLKEEIEAADICVGFLGIGADGHTAGILPHSVALDSDGRVVSYTGPDFERITITDQVIRELDMAVAYATGEAKRPQLERLRTDQPAADQPAQLLKHAHNAMIFSDTVGTEVAA